jgi:hypothetical protein
MHVYRTVEDGGGFGLFVVLLPVAQDLCVCIIISLSYGIYLSQVHFLRCSYLK